jgi:hypothetical protein
MIQKWRPAWKKELNQLSLLGTFGNINRAIGPIYKVAIDAGVGKIVVYAPRRLNQGINPNNAPTPRT